MIENEHLYINFYDDSNYNENLDYYSHVRKFRNLSKIWADSIHIQAFCNKFNSQIIIFKRMLDFLQI